MISRRTAIFIAAAMALPLSACGQKKEEGRPPTVVVERRDVRDVLRWDGKVTSAKKVPIFSESTGQIMKLYVDQGQKVSKGDLLLEIDKSQLVNAIEKQKIALQKVQIQLENAEDDFNRKKALNEEKFIPRSEYEASEKALQLAKLDHSMSAKELEALERELEKVVITAPISGVVTKKNVDEGEVVGNAATGAQGKLLLEITDPDQKRITIYLAETERALMKTGQAVQFWPEFSEGTRFGGRVVKIDDLAQQAVDNSTSFRAEIEPDGDSGSGLSIGGTMTVEAILAEAKDVPSIAADAVFGENGRHHVYLKTKSGYEKRPVETGVSGTNYVEIVSGVASGDIVYKEEPAH